MSTLTTAQRLKLPLSDFGEPDRRRFPIIDQSDVDAAAKLIGRAQDPAAVKKRIISIVRRKGLKLPEPWQDPRIAEGKRQVKAALSNAGK